MEKDKNLNDRFIVYCVQRPDHNENNVWNTNVFINGIFMGSIRKVGRPLDSGIYNLRKVKDPRDIEGDMEGKKITLSANIEKADKVDGYIINKNVKSIYGVPITEDNKFAKETANMVARYMSNKGIYKCKKKIIWVETMAM